VIRRIPFFIISICILTCAAGRKNVLAEPYEVDPTFTFVSTNVSVINDLLLLPDGRIAIAGAGPDGAETLEQDGSFAPTFYNSLPSPFVPVPPTC
jgi:hypothetical protein